MRIKPIVMVKEDLVYSAFEECFFFHHLSTIPLMAMIFSWGSASVM